MSLCELKDMILIRFTVLPIPKTYNIVRSRKNRNFKNQKLYIQGMGTGKKIDVFEELLIADNKILKSLGTAKQNHKKILDMFARRVTLQKECADKQDDPMIKAIIDAKKSVIMSDMGLLSTQYEIQSDILKIISRIVVLERKLSQIQGKESP